MVMRIVLVEPEIPPNTGNIARLCAATGAELHLIEPLGFELDNRRLKRAGMDYWKELEVLEYDDWENFWKSTTRPQRIHLLTTHAENSIWETKFQHGDRLLFGNEGHGAPDNVHQAVSNRIRIPKFKGNLRSLNLAVSVGIASYEALRQIRP